MVTERAATFSATPSSSYRYHPDQLSFTNDAKFLFFRFLLLIEDVPGPDRGRCFLFPPLSAPLFVASAGDKSPPDS